MKLKPQYRRGYSFEGDPTLGLIAQLEQELPSRLLAQRSKIFIEEEYIELAIKLQATLAYGFWTLR